MANANDRSNTGKTGEVRHADPNNAATDPRAAAQQDQIKADHDALQRSAERTNAPSTPATDPRAAAKQDQVRAVHDAMQRSATRSDSRDMQPATDASAAAKQDRVKADHDALQASAQRVKSSVPADVRNTPVQPSDENRNPKR